MVDFTDLTSIPAAGAMNGGLTSPKNQIMLDLLGVPGKKTEGCSNVTNPKLKAMMRYGVRITPNLRVSGLASAVESLKTIFAQIKSADARLWAECRTAGMLCCRLQRGSDHLFSNHSWGTGIDLYFGDGVVPQGEPKTQIGIFKLYPYFHNAGWYWGAEFPRPDAMHFECSTELLKKWKKAGQV